MRGCEDDSRGNMKSYYVDVGMTGCECALCVNVYASLRNIGYNATVQTKYTHAKSTVCKNVHVADNILSSWIK